MPRQLSTKMGVTKSSPSLLVEIGKIGLARPESLGIGAMNRFELASLDEPAKVATDGLEISVDAFGDFVGGNAPLRDICTIFFESFFDCFDVSGLVHHEWGWSRILTVCVSE